MCHERDVGTSKQYHEPHMQDAETDFETELGTLYKLRRPTDPISTGPS